MFTIGLESACSRLTHFVIGHAERHGPISLRRHEMTTNQTTTMVKFEAGREQGTVLAMIAGKVSFPDRSGPQPKVGETWEVQVTGTNSSGKVNFLKLIRKMELKEWTWNNGIGSRSRQPACLVITSDGAVHRFTGQDIPGVVKVVNSKYQKNGKWSNTTYTCASPAGTSIYSWSQSWEEGLYWPQASWEEALVEVQQHAPQIDAGSFETAVRAHWGKAAEKFDENRRALAELAGFAAPASIAEPVADTLDSTPEVLKNLADNWQWVMRVETEGNALVLTFDDNSQVRIDVSKASKIG